MLNWGANPCSISLHILSIIYPLLFIILILFSDYLTGIQITCSYWKSLIYSNVWKQLNYIWQNIVTWKKRPAPIKNTEFFHRMTSWARVSSSHNIHRGRKAEGENNYYKNSQGSVLRIRDLNNCWSRKLFFCCGTMCSAIPTSCRYLCSTFDLLLMFIEAKQGKRW